MESTCGAAGRVKAGAFVVLLGCPVHSLLLALGSVAVPSIIVPSQHVVAMNWVMPIACMRRMCCMVAIATICSGMCALGGGGPLASFGLTAIAG